MARGPGLSGHVATAQAVEQQMRNWELARLQRPVEAGEPGLATRDFVAISRQPGLDGGEVARRLAERLAWPFFDRELLDHMAGDDRLRRQLYQTMDERDLGWWEEAMRPLTVGSFQVNDYFHRLCDAILKLARQGEAIFLGRGADLILPRERGLRVRLVASRDFRVRHVAETLGCSIDEARAELERREGERAHFLRHHFRVEAEDPARFDLALNLERFSPREAADAVFELRESRQRARR